MPSDIADYLASRYLVADPKPTSKKRKQKSSSAEGLVITEDDDWAWSQSVPPPDENDEELPQTVSGNTAEFRKARRSNWKSIGRRGVADVDDNMTAANAVLTLTAAENESRLASNDDIPIVENMESVVKMSDGTHAGLQTAAMVSAQIRKRQREEREKYELHRKSTREEETVYRDATGRRIDVSMKRAEARKAAADAEEQESLAKQALRGRTQIQEARKRNERLQEAQLLPFARTAEDKTMNQELMEQERWNDPMHQFVSKLNVRPRGGKTNGKQPMYSGAAPPNRYGIQPGYRWDGVDRSIGFEAERFRAINKRDRVKGLDYSWQMDE
ncbi:Pre-mRNA-splicing factor cwc26 [Conoideocrella luteorostrata]|uniref:Pre-mRNA-splicing factor cwc26 n=1 Tax=Conoideocrella luteorostrata TaxID=1105319 RepID=A0AAJ0CIE1_9HYPO|nr:Pre-mRNA-splicing factor cwc26 [Conoideocrella luteorostrata]